MVVEFSSANVLAGHLGQLTPEQQKVFHIFKGSLEVAGLTATPAREDDATLLRFLRARSFDPTKAQKQFADAAAWRKKYDVDRLYRDATAAEMEKTRAFYPRWTGRRDKRGLPIYVYRIASLASRKNEMDAVRPEDRLLKMIPLYEYMTQFVLPLCSHLPHPTSPWPIASVTTIVDLDEMTLSALWNFRSHLQQASTLATANYPETLSITVVVNSPSFFPTVWGWIKPWFDVGTRNKIHVLGRDHTSLSELIDKSDLPKAYGGELAWAYDPLQPPALDKESVDIFGPEVPTGAVFFRNGKVVDAKDASQ